MASDGTGRFDIPEVRDAVSIERAVARLRGYIGSECSTLLRRAGNAVPPKVRTERAAVWKSRIDRILEVKDTTFSIEELEGLLQKCRDLSDELEGAGY